MTKWTIATARARLPKLIAAAARQPQRVYRRNKLVAVVTSPDDAPEPRSMADELADLHAICCDTDYDLPTVSRRSRANAFARPRR